MIRGILAFLILLLLLWMSAMVALPFFFIKHFEKKYATHVDGRKTFSLFKPKVKIDQASLVWYQKIALEKGDFEIEVDPRIWLRDRIWAIHAKGDGAQLRFLGDWLRKTGVDKVTTTRLRLALNFSNEGIQDIDTVDLVAPNYQLQIHSHEAKRS